MIHMRECEYTTVFLNQIEEIYHSKSPNIQVANSIQKIRDRDILYADITFKLMKDCWSIGLLDLPEVSRRKDKILCHVADVIYRRTKGLGSELDLSLDDILIVAVASQLSYDDTAQKKKPLLQYIPTLRPEERESLAIRIVMYQLQYVPEEYCKEKTESVFIILKAAMTGLPTNKELECMFNRNHSIILRRVMGFKESEISHLAILHPGAHIERSLDSIDQTYNNRFNTHSKNSIKRVTPL